MKKTILILLLLVLGIVIIMGSYMYIKVELSKTELLLNGEYDCEVEFKQAQFLGKGDNTEIVRGKRTGGQYDRFKILDTGKEIKLGYSFSNGHNGAPRAIIAICNCYSKDGELLKTEYDVYSDENFFIGRISGSVYNEKFYIYDAKNNFQIETNILENFIDVNGVFQKDLMKVHVYHNKDSKPENGISEFLGSTDTECIIGENTYKKIDNYETEYGNMYILEKNGKLGNYIGVLKYGDMENQELIFSISYSYLESADKIADFRLIVKEMESKI